MWPHTGVMSIEAFLANPAAPLLIDVRGGPASDPAIPGSISVYVIDISERMDQFVKKFEPQARKRPLLLYCSKGDASHYLQKELSGKLSAQSLQGGMVSYLTTISRLLHEHPYEDSSKRGDTLVKLLGVLTDRTTDPNQFRKIIERLLLCTPNPKFRKLLRS
ncbi:MAG: rhodanese-like domain-containing protein [Magnetococcales bacterium]|nr:rhodanese-like domain-containing protein [Magnetococcales bacterium]